MLVTGIFRLISFGDTGTHLFPLSVCWRSMMTVFNAVGFFVASTASISFFFSSKFAFRDWFGHSTIASTKIVEWLACFVDWLKRSELAEPSACNILFSHGLSITGMARRVKL